MTIQETYIEGLLRLETKQFKDHRGTFRNISSIQDIAKDNGFTINELYYSVSHKNVIRGMHFQIPPFGQDKLIYVAQGKIIDVVLDLREESNTFMKYFEIEISDQNNLALFIPKECAHGFKAMEDNTIMFYAVNSAYNKEAETGIRWDSFGYEWGEEIPIMSDRDIRLPILKKYLLDQKKGINT